MHTKPNTPAPFSSEKKGTRVPKTISLPTYQDRWLTDTLGAEGNVSGFLQALVDAAMSGTIDVKEMLKKQKDQTAHVRAAAYLKAKEASMLFEEDVGNAVMKWLGGRRGLRVSRGRIHNGAEGSTFVADFSVERENGEVLCSVNCKSSPRGDRLHLALAEAMIGAQKTGKPVVTVVPYLIGESADVAEQFKLLKYQLATLGELAAALDKVVTK